MILMCSKYGNHWITIKSILALECTTKTYKFFNRRKYMVMEGDLALGDEHRMQYKDDVLLNCTPEIYKFY